MLISAAVWLIPSSYCEVSIQISIQKVLKLRSYSLRNENQIPRLF